MPPGPQRIGPYQIRGELGRGGMGVVYRAWRADLQREYALKCVLPNAAAGSGGEGPETELRRFEREAQAAARLGKHPNVVQVHDVGRDGDVRYLVMDLVEGRGLDRVVADEPLEPRRAAAIAAGIARGVAHAHAHGILHRDLKPANVLLGPHDVPQVTDFGLARDVRGGSALTVSGTLLGTPEYMAPEQSRGAEFTTERSEVYGVGATLYHLLAGRPPHIGNAAVEVLASLAAGAPTPLRLLAPHCPWDLVAVVEQALAREPLDRYASVTELAEDLERFASGAGVRARRVPAAARAWRAMRRHPAAVLLGAGALLAAGAAAVAIRAWRREAVQRADTEASHREAQATATEAAAAAERLAARAEPVRRALALGLGPESRAARIALLDGALAEDPACVPALLARAATHAAGGNLGAAGRGLDAAVRCAPADIDALAQRARFHRDRTGDLDACRADFERAAALAAESANGRLARAWLAWRDRRPEAIEALVVAARAAGAPPAECSFLEGLHEQSWNRHEAACARYLEATREDPHLMPAYHRRAQCLEDLGRDREAEAEIERAIAASPEDYNSYYYRGRQRARRGRYQEAHDDYTRVLAGRPDHPQALVNRANAARRLGRPADALADLDRAATLAPEIPEILGARADALADLGRNDEALACFGHAIDADPSRAVPWFNRGCLLMNLDRPADARSDFLASIERDPGYARAWQYRGYAEQRLGRLPEAADSLARAVDLDPADWRARRRQADILELLSRHEAAAAACRAWTELTPKDGEAWMGWARCLAAQGARDVAEGVLLRGLGEVAGTNDEPRLRAALAALRR